MTPDSENWRALGRSVTARERAWLQTLMQRCQAAAKRDGTTVESELDQALDYLATKDGLTAREVADLKRVALVSIVERVQ